MTYVIRGLERRPFADLLALDAHRLAARGAERVVASGKPGFPCRVTLRDAEPGQTLVLVSYTHQDAATPYGARGPIYVGVDTGDTARYDHTLPPVMQTRPQSLRAYDAAGFMVEADVADGADAVESLIERLLARADTAYVHAHFARQGCYVARIDRR